MKKVAEVLEGLRDEERRLSVELSGVRRAIAALEEVIGIAPEQPALQPTLAAPAPAVPLGPYATGGFYEAAASYLAAAGEPQTARQIAEALRAGGYPTRATNFTATVRTMLHREFSASAYGIYPTEKSGRWFARN
jgi:hypothetical protein